VSDPRKALIEAARAMNAAGINLGTSGNLSHRHHDGMLITPTGMSYDALQVEDIVYMTPEGPVGPRLPSSEWRFHEAIYASRPDASAVVHAHPCYSTALACMHQDIPAFHYEVALAGGHDIRCAKYDTFGTRELAINVVAALEGRKACLIANHGVVTLGADLEAALALARRVEHLARIYCQCLQAGQPQILDQAEMSRVLEKFSDYGQ
jgi:L-fuculose-phosphate aldolase